MYKVSTGRNVTISISDRNVGAIFHLSLSLELGREEKKPDCSSIPGHFIQAWLVNLHHSKVLVMTLWGVLGVMGGPRGLQHQYEYSLALSGQPRNPFD